MRFNLRALLATTGLAAVILDAAVAAPTTPASAVTCPAGSTTFNTESDANGNHLAQNADNFGPAAVTCFSDTGSSGQLTVTQADHSSDSVNPTSYPSDDYGCTFSLCTQGWTTKSWNQATHLKVTASLSNTGVNGNDAYDYLLDQLLTCNTCTGTNPPTMAEVEIVLNAKPSFPGLGFCRATACGATQVTVNGVSWWRKKVTAAVGGWPDYIYCRNTAVSSVTGLDVTNFFKNANAFDGGLAGLFLASTWSAGTELWPRTAGDGGLGLTVNSASITGEP